MPLKISTYRYFCVGPKNSLYSRLIWIIYLIFTRRRYTFYDSFNKNGKDSRDMSVRWVNSLFNTSSSTLFDLVSAIRIYCIRNICNGSIWSTKYEVKMFTVYIKQKKIKLISKNHWNKQHFHPSRQLNTYCRIHYGFQETKCY